ncbi:MAG: hypothetical protein KBA30_00585, partial [Clostridia bacterium]|nr:hypothetical protein [Clostridia bacterium]
MRVQCVLRDSLRSFDRLYTYAVPEALQPQLRTGCLVTVPFGPGNRTMEAYVVSCGAPGDPDDGQPVKEILSNVSGCPVLLEDQ